MLKYVFLFVLCFSVFASTYQTKEEIIEYCTRTYLKDFGNETVLHCIKTELVARDKIAELSKQ